MVQKENVSYAPPPNKGEIKRRQRKARKEEKEEAVA